MLPEFDMREFYILSAYLSGGIDFSPFFFKHQTNLFSQFWGTFTCGENWVGQSAKGNLELGLKTVGK